MKEEAEGSWELVREALGVLWQRCVYGFFENESMKEQGVSAGGSMSVIFAGDIRVTLAPVTDGKAEEERSEALKVGL